MTKHCLVRAGEVGSGQLIHMQLQDGGPQCIETISDMVQKGLAVFSLIY